MALVRSMDLDQTERIGFSIQHKDKTQSLGLVIFMDDIDAPDIEFFTVPDLLKVIQHEHQKLCDELGI